MGKAKNSIYTDLSAKDSLYLDIDGTQYKVSQFSASWAVNEIPTAQCLIATGRDARSKNAATPAMVHLKSHYKVITKAKVYFEPSGEYAPDGKKWPQGPQVIFDGYFLGFANRKMNGKISVVANLSHWLLDMACSSCLTAGLAPTNHTQLTAAAVMAAYEEHGVELMIDLEHLSLDDTAPNYDPDARGWLAIEVRNGELWATGVRWTPDGSRRLDEKTQRYISPAFKKDADGRPTRVLNVALVAMPGLDGITALAAKEQTMASEVNQEALAAALGVDIDPAADPAGFVAAMKKALEGAMSKFGGGESDPGESEAPAPEAMADKKPPAEEMAAAKLVLKLTDTSKLSDAAGRIADWRGIVASHEAEVKKLAEERAARAAGFESRAAIGPYLRSLIATHHDNLAGIVQRFERHPFTRMVRAGHDD